MTATRKPATLDQIARAARLFLRAYDHLAQVGVRLGSAGVEATDGTVTIRLLPEPPIAVQPSSTECSQGGYAVVSLSRVTPSEDAGTATVLLSALVPRDFSHRASTILGEVEGVHETRGPDAASRILQQVRVLGEPMWATAGE